MYVLLYLDSLIESLFVKRLLYRCICFAIEQMVLKWTASFFQLHPIVHYAHNHCTEFWASMGNTFQVELILGSFLFFRNPTQIVTDKGILYCHAIHLYEIKNDRLAICVDLEETVMK